MKVKDKISDNYRKQVDDILTSQSNPEPFDPLAQEEQDEIWEGISTELDLGEVWNGISSNLDTVMPVDSGSGFIVKSITIVLIILLGMIPVKKILLDSGITQPGISNETRPNQQSTDLIIKNKSGDSRTGEQAKEDISAASRSSLDKIEDGSKPIPTERNRKDLGQETQIPASIKVVSKVLVTSEMADTNLVVSRAKIPIEKSNVPPVLFPGDLEKIELLFEPDYSRLKINNITPAPGVQLPLIERGKISLGLITMFKNSWLLNNETLDGLKSESLTTTEIVFFPDVGLSFSYSLNNYWQLQADGLFISNTGQKYLGYYNGHYSRKEITLRYSTFALSVKYKYIGKEPFMHRSAVNLLAGGYLSVLHSVNQKINTEIENISSQYRKFDLGVRIGGEFELQILDQLSVAPGLFLSIGIPNIYKGNGNIPGYFRRTHNGSAELHLAFYIH